MEINATRDAAGRWSINGLSDEELQEMKRALGAYRRAGPIIEDLLQQAENALAEAGECDHEEDYCVCPLIRIVDTGYSFLSTWFPRRTQ